MIRFRTETTLQVITEFDKENDNIVDEVETTFKQGEKVDADIYSDDGSYVDIRFADGSIATSVLKDDIEVM